MLRECLHRRKPFWNVSYVEMLSHRKRLHSFDIHLDGTGKFFFAITVRLITQNQSSIKSDQLRHRVSRAAWNYLASHQSSMLVEKNAGLGNKEGPSTSIVDQISGPGKLLYSDLHPHSFLLLSTNQKLETILSSPCLVELLSLSMPGNVTRQFCPHRMRPVRLSRPVIVDVINGILEL